jgi:protein-disulfide isomerase
MKLTGESKLFLGILLASAAVIGIAAVLLTKPAPTFTREELLPQTAHTKGNKEAKAYLVEFSDFQCPACLAAKPTVDAVVNQYKDKLIFSYRYFPLDQHPFGEKTAIAAEAAAAQGKFWEAYDFLFANQDAFSDSFLAKFPTALKLDEVAYMKALDDPATKNRVLDDLAAGNRFGVNSTPTFFLNGKKLDLMNFADLKTAVEEAVKNTK